MRRRLPAMTVLMAMVGASLFLLAPAASAQPYPPGECTVTVGDSGNLATVGVGDTATLTIRAQCSFTPGATVSVVVNGQAAGTKTVNADGSVTVTVNVQSTTQLSVNPVVRGQCGANTVSVSGPSSSVTGSSTQNASFTVVCPAAAATPVRGRVAFTGSNIFRWGAVALVLAAVGGGLVMADRRRKRA